MDTTFRTHDFVPGTVRISGSFRPNGSSALSNTAARNTLFGAATITRDGAAGKFLVVLPFGANKIRSLLVGYRLSALPAAVASIMVLGAPTVTASSITFTIQYAQNNVAADIADNAANWIDFALVLDNGTVPL
jgi:hypothetical protein